MKDTTWTRLAKDVERCRAALKPFREERYALIKNYIGSMSSETSGAGLKRNPVNFMELAVAIYASQLIARAPRVKIGTRNPELRRVAADLELAMNFLIRQLGLVRTLRCVVQDSFWGLGIAKVAFGESGALLELDGNRFDPGAPFAEPVDMDDWVHDVAARRYESVAFAGNRYQVDLEDARENTAFSAKRSELVAAELEGGGEERVHSLSGGDARPYMREDRFRAVTELWDIWLPREGVIVTFGSDEHGRILGERVLAERQWYGPECGPYHLLSLIDVPQSIMPMPLATLWASFQQVGGASFAKLCRQARDAKAVTTYQGSAEGDAQTLRLSADGEMVRVDHVEGVKRQQVGGISPELQLFFRNLVEQFSHFGGGLNLMGGLSAQSETLGQDQLLAQNATVTMQERSAKVVDLTEGVVRALAWYLWEDPHIELPLTRRLPELGLEIPVTWNQESKEGEFLDYNLTVNPYSLQRQSPASKAQILLKVLNDVLVPNQQAFAQQEAGISWERVLRDLSDLADIPEVMEWLVFSQPTDPESPPVGAMPQKLARTQREYVRRSKGAADQYTAQKSAQMDQMLMAASAGGGDAA